MMNTEIVNGEISSEEKEQNLTGVEKEGEMIEEEETNGWRGLSKSISQPTYSIIFVYTYFANRFYTNFMWLGL